MIQGVPAVFKFQNGIKEDITKFINKHQTRMPLSVDVQIAQRNKNRKQNKTKVLIALIAVLL